MEKTYTVKYFTSQKLTITNQLLADIKEWQSRPLSDQYAVVWIDAIRSKIHQDGKVKFKACMVCPWHRYGWLLRHTKPF